MKHPFHPRLSLALSLLPPFLALAVQSLFWESIQPFAWLLFFPAIILSAWLGGLAGGTIATFLAACMVEWFFMEPRHSFLLSSPTQVLSIAVYSTTGLLIAYFLHRLQRHTAKLAHAQARAEQALAAAKSEALFRAVFEQPNLGVALVDSLSGQILDANPRLAEIVGRAQPELATLDWMSLTHPDDVQGDLDNMARLNAGEFRGFQMDKRYIRPDGEWVWIRLTVTQVAVGAGEKPRHLALVEDITERLRMEEALAEAREAEARYASEQRLMAVIEQDIAGVVEANLEGRLTRVNDRYCAMLGYSKEEALEMRIQDFTLPEDWASSKALLNTVLARGQTGVVEKRYRRKDGSVVWASVSVALIRDMAGQPMNFAALILDITQRKQAEATLHESLERYRVLAETMLQGVVHQDAAGNIIAINPAAEQILGRSQEQLLGSSSIREDIRTLREDGSPFPGSEHPSMVALRTRQPVRGVLMGVFNPRRDEYRWINIDAVPVFRPGETRPAEVYAVFEDVTEKRQAESALRAEEATRKAARYARSLIEASPDPLVTISAEGKITDVNAATEAVTGRSREELVGSDFCAYFTEPDKALAGYRSAFNEGRVRDYPLVIRHTSGRVADVLYNANVYRDEAGIVKGVFAAARDITARKRAEDALREKEERLALATLHNGVGIWDWNLATQQMIWDDSMYALYRIRREDFIGTEEAWRAALHPDDLERADREVEAAIAGERPFDTEFRVLWSNGEVRHIKAVAKLFRDGRGVPVRMLGTNMDITQLKQAEEDLRRSEQKFRILAESMPQMVWMTTPDGLNVYHNQQWLDYTGLTMEESTGRGWAKPIHPDDLQRAWDAWSQATQTDSVYSIELRLRRADGAYRWWLVRGVSLHDADGKVVNWFGSCTDIQDIKEAEEKLRLAASVFSHAREGIFITDAQGAIVDANTTCEWITGYPRDEVLGKNPRIFKSGRHEPAFYAAMWQDLLGKGHWYGEIWNRRKNGEVFASMLAISAVRDACGQTQSYVALFSDITPIKEHQQQLERIAHYDALTGLPNRLLLADRLHLAMAQAQRHGDSLAVVYLDLDGFKAVNDQHGHVVGDKLLIAVARRMKSVLREADTLARIGGDEFVAVLADLKLPLDCEPMLARLLRAAAEPVSVGHLSLQVSTSIGVTIYPQDDADADQLLRHADQAMYVAKQSGKNRYHLFDLDKDLAAKTQRESLDDIRRGMGQDEFVLHYQPKVNMKTGAVVGAEALIRRQHPQLGLLPPSAFMPLIEDHNLGVELGEWVIDKALAQMEEWLATGFDLIVSVNIGARHLLRDGFAQRLRGQFESHPGIPLGHLELEVRESNALEDLEKASQIMQACCEMGVRFTLDDFGTGYSSLTYLKRLPVEMLKIDQSFVRDMLENPEDLAIVEGVAGLATAFRHQVIAEGVETVSHGELLLALGCELGQGYAIARPMPGTELPGWVAAWRQNPAWISWRDRPPNRNDLAAVFAEVKHRQWLRAVMAFLSGDRNFPPPMDAESCDFGRWLDSDGAARYGENPGFPMLGILYARVYAKSQELFDLYLNGQKGEVQEGIRELQELSNELVKRLRGLVCGS